MGDGRVIRDEDWTGAEIREVVLTRARLLGVLLNDAEIDGDIRGLVVNGVEVEPLIEAELERRHPERALLKATDPDGLRAAWAALEDMWAPTMEQALARPEADLHRSVGGEWSFTETLRHLVFVTDAWLTHAVVGEPSPYHPVALLATFMPAGSLGLEPAARPGIAEVVEARQDRVGRVRAYLAAADQAELDREREVPGGYPPPAPRTAVACLHVVFQEEWWHHRYAVRDLAQL